MSFLFRAWSLRGKLIAACALVQVVGCIFLIHSSVNALQAVLMAEAASEKKNVTVLLDQALAAPLAQRDYATIQQTLELMRSDDFIRYLSLSDHRGQVVASTGWDSRQPLPARDTGELRLDSADSMMHLAVPVKIGGQQLGNIDLGLCTARLNRTRSEFLVRSLIVGSLVIALSILILSAIAFAVTRHLRHLTRASAIVAAGDLDVQVQVTSGDEIGLLGQSFNSMTAALKQRVSALKDSEARQQALLQEVRGEHSRITTLLGAIEQGIVFADADSKVIYANAAFGRIWSIPGSLDGLRLGAFVPYLAKQAIPAHAPLVGDMLRADRPENQVGHEIHTLDERVITVRMQPITPGSNADGYIWFHDDVTIERQTQHRAYLALHDSLTKVLNRRGFYEFLQARLASAAQDGTDLALLYIDLDDFKHANDAGGHRVGDEILATVASTLAAQLRRDEIVSRLGGDEFAVICPATGKAEASDIAARLIGAVARLRFPAATQSLRVGCSIGIATFPHDAKIEDDLVACADAAMYLAKQDGKNGWAAYRRDAAGLKSENARVDWNAKIQGALQDQRLVLHFQSVHWASDLRVSHHEALLRMVDEFDPATLISPTRFLPHAERSGVIRQIDRWVFESCIAQLAKLDTAICIAANLSAKSLEDPGFPELLRESLQRHNVDPNRLHIELTETSAISEVAEAKQMIDALCALGCAVHLDDFGSGFSSFTHLKVLDIDAVKIDGEFIRNLQSDPTNRLFVTSMIDIAHSLGKLAAAEHVEDAATLEILRSLGVDLVQGYHVSQPVARLLETDAPTELKAASVVV